MPTIKIPKVNVKKRGSTYTYYFELPSVEGKRKQESKGGFKTAEEALAAGEFQRDKTYGLRTIESATKESLVSFEDFVTNEWLPKRKNLKESTKANYSKLFRNYVFPRIGSRPLWGITSDILYDILDEMYYEDNRSYETVSHVHSLLLNVMRYAKEHDYNKSFFESEFALPKKDSEIEAGRKKRDVVPKASLDRIFQRFPEGTSSFPIFAICLFTGMRVGEAAGLAIEDCDFDNRIIHVSRQIPDINYGIVCDPKNDSKRDVPMCETLKNILERAISERKKNEELFKDNYLHTYLARVPNTKKYRNTDNSKTISYEEGAEEIHFICVNERGNVTTPSVTKHACRIIHGWSCNHKNKKRGTPIHLNFDNHSLRHTFISHLYNNGIDKTLIGGIAGHKKTISPGESKTTDRYIHIDKERIIELNDLVERIYSFPENVLKETTEHKT